MSQAISNAHKEHHTQFTASDHLDDGKHHLLLAASGSVATIKIPNILNALSHYSKLAICVVLTKSATNFLAGQSAEQPSLEMLRQIENVEAILVDEEEWVHSWKRGNSILHIELRRWAHVLVIAPLSANTLAKITGGFSDNLLTSIVRAWDTTGDLEMPGAAMVSTKAGKIVKKRIIVAPAMNTAMWRHPITKRQIKVLEEEWGVGEESFATEGEDTKGWFQVLRPQEKELACGDVGDGAMKDWKLIVEVIENILGL
jgi:phosphopantothenoylcysteine decarboxylase